ncbi:MAG: hypothetical protein ACFBSD_10305 [Paracoccaceae bacterium]
MFRPRRKEPSAPHPEPRPAPPALFDAAWYARRGLPEDADPFAHYAAEGATAGHSPCPLFSPSWYRAAYPDVALSGQEPLAHWCAHGADEGRAPSALFATRAYREALGEALNDTPLAHCLGLRGTGPAPHPALKPFDPYAVDLAFVIAYRGDRAALELTLWALRQARSAAPITAYLVDGGAEPERSVLDDIARANGGDGLTITRHCEFHGDTYGMLANAGVWAARQRGGHSHIGILEQAAVVEPGFADRLVDLWAPVAAPVLNIADTPQWVPIDFDIYATPDPRAAVAAFAERRRHMIPGGALPSAEISPACLLFHAAALAEGGFFDDAAETAEDAVAPVLRRLAERGLGPPVIERTAYVHRLERSPVVTGEGVRAPAGGVTRPGAPAPTAQRLHGLALSAMADRRDLRTWTADAPPLLAAYDARMAACREALDVGFARQARRLTKLEGGETGAGAPVLAFEEIAAGDPPRTPGSQDRETYRLRYRSLLHILLRRLAAGNVTQLDPLVALQPVLAGLAALFDGPRPVLVLTMDTDPVTGNEKDGYVQRVVAIDKALADCNRIYLKMVAARRDAPALVYLEDGIWRLEIAHDDRLGRAVLGTLLEGGAAIYSQSLVGIDPPVVRELLPERTGPFLMDMHGAVPEEFILYENHYMAQKYARFEDWAASHADIVVCVTDTMAAHFEEKLGLARDRLLVCPIFTHTGSETTVARPYNARPRAIYAGGTQRWQMIPEMAALAAETHDRVDWCLLTPDVEGMEAALATAGLPAGAVSVRAATQAQVFDAYRRSDFGLLLREEGVVNRVACPTKLIEYLRFGVIPVLQTPEVGDFHALGLEYVSAGAFRAGELPDLDRRRAMAEANFTLFRRLVSRSAEGRRRIAEAAARGRPPASKSLIRSTS